MLDPKLIRSSIDEVAQKLSSRGYYLDTQRFSSLESQRKLLQTTMQRLQNERNVHSKAIGIAKAKGAVSDEQLQNLKALSDELKKIEDEFAQNQLALDRFLAEFPNLPHSSVPIGENEDNNKLIRTRGTPKVFDFAIKDHVALGAAHQGIDFETAAKISGARFVVLHGLFAKLQRALIQFMLDLHINEHGYQEITVPYLVNEDSLFGTGQLPKMKDDIFAIQGHGHYLIPTAEVPVTNSVRDTILEHTELPLKYVCYSSCFRSEAGSYGKDMRGMLRQHQFEKVELVEIVAPQKSYEALENLTQHAEVVLQRLELPYRVMALCTGDLGFASAKTYDLEVWLPGQDRYREISSCSNMEAFQARRMKARWRDENGKVDGVHTLNGSALAVGRTMIALIENNQDALGRIHIPNALQPYMGGLKVIE